MDETAIPDDGQQEPPQEQQLAIPGAVPVQPSVEQAQAELADNPARTSVLSDAGHVVRA